MSNNFFSQISYTLTYKLGRFGKIHNFSFTLLHNLGTEVGIRVVNTNGIFTVFPDYSDAIHNYRGLR